MARTTTKLTNTEVQQAKPGEKTRLLSDGGGLQLRINTSGSKKWIFNYYRPLSKSRTGITLGTFPALSLADARKQAIRSRELLGQGIDPQQYRDEQERHQIASESNTLEHVSTLWFDVKKAEVSPDYADDVWRSLTRHIFPLIGNLPIAKITAPRVIEVLRPIEAKGNLETIKRLSQRLNEVMDYAVNHGLIQANPLSGIRKVFKRPKKQHMPALKPDELPSLMLVIAQASIKKTTRCLIEWQLHTLTRPSEAAGTMWNEIDFKAKTWTIPAERMKKRRTHTIPLTNQALALLAVMKPISEKRDHVFPSDRNPRTHTNSQTVNMALKRMGFAGILVSHGLRSIGSTTLNEEGFDADIIESALAHVDTNDVRSAYNRADYLKRRRSMMEWWSTHIEKSATGSYSLAANRRDSENE